MFTITDLKKNLGPGLGLRKNKYLIEIPVPGIEGEKINILCRSAGLPERNINTTTVWHKGRKYNVRAETDYVGSYEVSILDDSSMNIRKTFDKWMKKVDNSRPVDSGIAGASYENDLGDVLDVVTSGLEVANQIKNAVENPADAIGGYFLGLLDANGAASIAKYQTDINVWQLSSDGQKVYGYKLQNAFPSAVGIVTLDDGDENTLSEFSVTFTFSEFIPLENKSLGDSVVDAIIGDTGQEIVDGIEALFD
jgi:hypothetical protein